MPADPNPATDLLNASIPAPISVLIVNYRSYDHLEVCLASLREAITARSCEAIVVDNATVPDALEAVRQRQPGVTFVPIAANLGFAGGVNEAARHAAGKYLVLLNPDAAVDPGALGKMTEFLAAHPAVGAVGGRVSHPDGVMQRTARSFPTPLTAFFGRKSLLSRLWPENPISRRNLVADDSTVDPIAVDWVAGTFVMFPADAFRAVGGMDAGFFLYWEDADICRRLRNAGKEVFFLPSARVVHQCAASSSHAPVSSLIAFHRSAFRYYRKHTSGALRELRLAAAAVGLFVRLLAQIAVTTLASRTASPDSVLHAEKRDETPFGMGGRA